MFFWAEFSSFIESHPPPHARPSILCPTGDAQFNDGYPHAAAHLPFANTIGDRHSWHEPQSFTPVDYHYGDLMTQSTIETSSHNRIVGTV